MRATNTVPENEQSLGAGKLDKVKPVVGRGPKRFSSIRPKREPAVAFAVGPAATSVAVAPTCALRTCNGDVSVLLAPGS